MNREPASPLVVVVGNLTIDDVVLPTGATRMATLGGNSVHAATAVITAGASAALVARRGEDFPAGALDALAAEGVDLSSLIEITGPTVRNWVVYEEDGRRQWLYRTPLDRSEQVAPEPSDLSPALLGRAAVVHVAAMPLGHAERIVARVREQAPGALITLDTHESWDSAVADRVLALASSVDWFVPSMEELSELTGAESPVPALSLLAAAGVGRAVAKAAAAGAYVLDSGRITRVPALRAEVADSTGAGDAFCGGLAAGLARGLGIVESVGLGAAVAGTAITASGSLRLFEAGRDRPGIAAAGHQLAAASTEVPSAAAEVTEPSGRYDIDVMRREILTIPDVVSDVLDDPDGHITALAKRLVARGVQHLWLTGCGDSAFAGLAAELAFQRHSGLTAHPVHALDLARYRLRAMPAGSAVIAISFSGQVGRTIEAAVQARRAGHQVVALTHAADGPLALACDEMLPVDVPTLGFSPGTSTYVAMLATLLRLAVALAELRGDAGDLTRNLGRLPGQVSATLRQTADACAQAASALLPARWVAFLGAGPTEATARFGAAKLFEGPQRLGVATSIEEWAHEQYFVTSAGDPVVLVNPGGAGYDRGEEILAELRFMGARPVVISDRPSRGAAAPGELAVPLAAGVAEEFSPVTACLPPALIGFHLARLTGRQSYNFSGEAARAEHYETIHRATIGEPA
ncbi:MAG TPA: PfkB family carbohydrate kinase [Streptosporangiaceae bacterium]|nr:PfkB family carbohydrate kinase [Streptosporangiaceae bacterium]